jgi:glycosyltransferase involved in cell wall biosynthesis
MSAALVSVIIPALNEEADIEECLAAVAAQDHPASALEVIVVDGCSDDLTCARARRVLARSAFRTGVVVPNPDARTSRSLNVGLATATGKYVVRVDARSRIQPDYVRRCVETLATRPEVGVVGGAQVAVPRGATDRDVGIARALRNRWTTGFSRYRRATRSGPSDTVWMGAFRREDLVVLGGWNADVALNEDFELCSRYLATGATVWFDHELRSGYVPRPDLPALGRQYFRFGRVKGTWWARGSAVRPRQIALLAAPALGLLAGLGLRRRIGTTGAVALAGAGLLGVELAGTRDPRGGVGAHATAAAAIVTSAGAWWIGTVVGFTGERLGVTHRHG